MSFRQNTLKNIIEDYHRQGFLDDYDTLKTIDDLCAEILLKLYRLEKGGTLSHETKIFLECRNSFIHIHNILDKVFLYGENVDIVIISELELITEDEKISILEPRLLMIENKFEKVINDFQESEERLKQTFFRKTSQLHGHIEHRDPEKLIVDMNNIIFDRLDTLERKMEDFVLNSQAPLREIIAQTLGIMLPQIINVEVGKIIKDNSKDMLKKLASQHSHQSLIQPLSIQPSSNQQVSNSHFSLIPPKKENTNTILPSKVQSKKSQQSTVQPIQQGNNKNGFSLNANRFQNEQRSDDDLDDSVF